MGNRGNVFVTGGTGFVGNNVIRKLVEEGCQVRALVRESSDLRPLADLDVEPIVGDVRNMDSLRRASQGAAAVVHAAAEVRIGWSMTGISEVNVTGTKNVAQAARESGTRLVYVSSVNALAIPDGKHHVADEDTPFSGAEVESNYVLSKRAADRVIQEEVERGLDSVCVYPGFMLGPWDWKPSSGRMLMAVANQFTPLAPNGGCSLCDVRDVASAIVRVATFPCPQRRYILAGHNMTYFDLWTLMARVSHGRPPVARMGPIVCWLAGVAGDMRTKLRGNEGTVNSAILAMSRQYHYYDSRRAQRDLRYRFREAESTVRDAWEWLRHQFTSRPA